MIFPGMDPYLEDSRIWTGFHARAIVYLCDQLQPLIEPRYIAAVEERVYVDGPQRDVRPDVWVRRNTQETPGQTLAVLDADEPIVVQVEGGIEAHESFVQILDRQTGQKVVTVIELVSPTNKAPGAGRDLYLAKQREVLASGTHLVEIDLLRTGAHVLAVPQWLAQQQAPYDYLVSVNRSEGARNRFDLYPRRLRERLPKIRVPLAGDDPDVPLDVQAVIAQVYDAGRYRDRLQYDAPCVPSLSTEDEIWTRQMIGASHST